MTIVFVALISIAVAVAALAQIQAGPEVVGPDSPMASLSRVIIESAGGAVTLSLGLIGVMALFLGLMKVAEAGGLLTIIARLLRPLMTRLFPEVPAEHPAMGAMIMNMAANMLGLGNAATPFGIKAMQHLDSLNPHKGTASNAMVLFLAINTSSITVLPTGIIALRTAAGSMDPAGIIPTTLAATVCSTTIAIIACKLYQRFAPLPEASTSALENTTVEPDEETLAMPTSGYPPWVAWLVVALVLALVPATVLYGTVVAPWIIPLLVLSMVLFGALRGVKVYEVFVEGARDGWNVAKTIIPYLVAILVAVAMLRESGAMALILSPLSALLGPLGLPGEALTMAMLRPLSGSGAYGFVASVLQDPAIGPDSYTGYLVSTLQGSTETTFYVLAVYFGAVRIKVYRHALPAALTADAAGVAGAVIACQVLYGHLV